MAQAALLAAQAEKDAAREAAAAQLLRLQARLEEADEPQPQPYPYPYHYP